MVKLTRLLKYLRLSTVLFAALPSSSNYNLYDYGFGAGGGIGSSANYKINGTAGDTGTGKSSSTNYKDGNGLSFGEQANVPPAPTLANTNNNYDRLQYVITQPTSTGSDYTYVIAISSDNFITTQYVQPDHTVSNVFSPSDYQTYSLWGGSSGGTIIGLTASTTYTIKVKAMHGSFTETDYSPTASATTSDPSLVFSIATDNQSTPPFSIEMNDLQPNTTVSSAHNIQVSFTTNANLGGSVYVAGQNSGLTSITASHTISSTSGSLGSVSEGFGAQGITATQSNGGPFSLTSLYAGSGDVVGTVDTSYREIFTASAPTTNGQGSFLFKARASGITPAATDYTEVLTLVASASF